MGDAYRSPREGQEVWRRAFEELLGEDLPANVADRPGEYTQNTPIADLLASPVGRRLRDLVAASLRRESAGEGTVFAGDPRDLALEMVPRMALQGGLTPAMVQTIVDALNGRWRATARGGATELKEVLKEVAVRLGSRLTDLRRRSV